MIQFEQALQIRPDHAETHNNLGIALAGRGRIADGHSPFSPGRGTQARFCRGPQESRNGPGPGWKRKVIPDPKPMRPRRSSNSARDKPSASRGKDAAANGRRPRRCRPNLPAARPGGPSRPPSRATRRRLPHIAIVSPVTFLFDDIPRIVENAGIRHLWPIWQVCFRRATLVGGRPVVSLTLAVNYALGGTSVWGYHFVNLAVHILAACTLLSIVRRTLLLPRGTNGSDRSPCRWPWLRPRCG